MSRPDWLDDELEDPSSVSDISSQERAAAQCAWDQHIQAAIADAIAHDEDRAVALEPKTAALLARCGANVIPFPAMTADQHRLLHRTLGEHIDAQPAWFRHSVEWWGMPRPDGSRAFGWTPEMDPRFLQEHVRKARREAVRAKFAELHRTPLNKRTPTPPADPPPKRRLRLRNRKPRLRLKGAPMKREQKKPAGSWAGEVGSKQLLSPTKGSIDERPS